MKLFKMFKLLYLLLLFLIIFAGCNRDFSTTPKGYEDFELSYQVVGGYQGKNDNLQFFDNNNVTFHNRRFSVKQQISQDKLEEIYSLLMANDFFNLDSMYVSDKYFVMDDTEKTITFQSATRSKTVFVSYYYFFESDAAWKDKLNNIYNYLDEYVNKLTSNPDAGKITIIKKYELEAWPFSEKVSLAENFKNKVEVDEEVFEYLKKRNSLFLDTFYLEGEHIYDITSSGGFWYSYAELDTFSISIYERFKGTYWPFETRLSDIEDNGLIVSDADYIWIRDILDSFYIPTYFYDSEIASGEYVYWIYLAHGNDF